MRHQVRNLVEQNPFHPSGITDGVCAVDEFHWKIKQNYLLYTID